MPSSAAGSVPGFQLPEQVFIAKNPGAHAAACQVVGAYDTFQILEYMLRHAKSLGGTTPLVYPGTLRGARPIGSNSLNCCCATTFSFPRGPQQGDPRSLLVALIPAYMLDWMRVAIGHKWFRQATHLWDLIYNTRPKGAGFSYLQDPGSPPTWHSPPLGGAAGQPVCCHGVFCQGLALGSRRVAYPRVGMTCVWCRPITPRF